MRKPFRHLALPLALSLLAGTTSALAEPKVGDGTLIATVNGQPYTLDLFRVFYAERVQQTGAQDSPELQEQAFNEFLNLVVAAQSGKERKLEDNTNVQTALELQRMMVLSGAALQQIAGEAEITEDELKKAYEQFVEQAKRTEYRARHILVEDKDKALDLIKKLDKSKGKDFEKLAKEHSIANADKSGDLGWFDARGMVKPFADAVAALEPGKYTAQPVQTQFGWHIIKLEETRPAEAPPFEEAKPALENALRQQKVLEALNKMRVDAKVELNDEVVRLKEAEAGAEGDKKD